MWFIKGIIMFPTLQTLVPPVERQWAQSPDLLLFHNENQVDSFILYIKGTILICKLFGLCINLI